MSWSRRAFLGGAAATVALPFLPSLVRGAARAADERPQRVLFFYVPNGFRMDLWTPAAGPALQLPPTLAPLAGLEDDVLVLSGLRNDAAVGDRPGDHARGTATFLTCTPIAFDGVANGPSVDQVLAEAWRGRTPFASLELGVEGGGSVGICDSGYSCAYTQNVSWSGPTTPMPKLTDPRLAFERLFAGSDGAVSAAEAARRRVYRTSVLDLVREQALALQPRLAVDDRHRLDEYLTGVREVETRVQSLAACSTDGSPDEAVDLEQKADVMLDLVVSAFRCDLTRVATFMLGNAASNLVYSFLPGVRGAHHELSHHQNQAGALAQLAVIDRWEVERFARLVRRLADTSDGDGRLLDRTLVVFGSEIGDGNRHNHDDLPFVLAGRGGGLVDPGRHLEVPGAPVAGLYLALLRGLGVDATRFGQDGETPLAGLTTS